MFEVFPFVLCLYLYHYLIVPNRVHAESLLWNIHTCHARKILVTESVNLDEAQLVIAERQPLVTPVAWAHSVGVAAAGRSRVDKQLALDVAVRAQLESGNVTGHIKVVAAGSCEKVFTTASGESDITAVLVARGKA